MRHTIADVKSPLIKYVVCPGNVRSKNDGQTCYISAQELISLYNVDPGDCYILQSPIGLTPFEYGKWDDNKKLLPPDAIYLRPRYHGNYTLEKRR